MTLSQFSVFLLLLLSLFPLRYASQPHNCPFPGCGDNVDVVFPFWSPTKQPEYCGFPGFNLTCSDNNKTILELPESGKFFIRKIDYLAQQILIYDPENCLAGRLLSFDSAGSPFSAATSLNFTFLKCPTKAIEQRQYVSIGCLSNSTLSILATSSMDLVNSMPPSCEIIRNLPVPVTWPVPYNEGFSTYLNDHDLRLKWNSPDCRDCERNQGTCGFINNGSPQVGCFNSEYPGKESTRFKILKIVVLSVVGPAIVLATCIAFFTFIYDRTTFRRRNPAAVAAAIAAAAPQPEIVLTGLDESTIQSYKEVELGESRRLPGPNGMTCPICLSEYASKETIRCIPECEHCFHTECIDEWLRLHNSCPVCRNSPSPASEAAPDQDV